jgi:hypothetical protein
MAGWAVHAAPLAQICASGGRDERTEFERFSWGAISRQPSAFTLPSPLPTKEGDNDLPITLPRHGESHSAT